MIPGSNRKKEENTERMGESIIHYDASSDGPWVPKLHPLIKDPLDKIIKKLENIDSRLKIGDTNYKPEICLGNRWKLHFFSTNNRYLLKDDKDMVYTCGHCVGTGFCSNCWDKLIDAGLKAIGIEVKK